MGAGGSSRRAPGLPESSPTQGVDDRVAALTEFKAKLKDADLELSRTAWQQVVEAERVRLEAARTALQAEQQRERAADAAARRAARDYETRLRLQGEAREKELERAARHEESLARTKGKHAQHAAKVVEAAEELERLHRRDPEAFRALQKQLEVQRREADASYARWLASKRANERDMQLIKRLSQSVSGSVASGGSAVKGMGGGPQAAEQRRQREAEQLRHEKELIKARAEEERKAKEAAARAKLRLEKELSKQRIREAQQVAQAQREARVAAEEATTRLAMQRAEVEAELDTKKWTAVVQAGLATVGTGVSSLLDNPEQLGRAVLTIATAGGALYVAREASRFGFRRLEAILGRPSLVRRTSRVTGWRMVVDAIRPKGWSSMEAHLTEVVLPPALHDRIHSLGVSTANTRRHGAPFRHCMFYGLPGTGKTLVATKLADFSGMDYAVMSGGDVAPLGAAAVTEIHKLFDWARASPKGLLLFIDEAESFLRHRSDPRMSEDTRNALNALLYSTGTESKHFAMVLATNRPADIDTAVRDRVDESLEFPLPDVDGRRRLVEIYFRKYLGEGQVEMSRGLAFWRKPPGKVEVDVEDVDGLLETLVHMTEGFSGRAIAQLMISIQRSGYGQEELVLTRDKLLRVAEWKVQQFQTDQEFDAAAKRKRRPSFGEQ